MIQTWIVTRDGRKITTVLSESVGWQRYDGRPAYWLFKDKEGLVIREVPAFVGDIIEQQRVGFARDRVGLCWENGTGDRLFWRGCLDKEMGGPDTSGLREPK